MRTPGLPLTGKGRTSQLVVTGDIHFNDHPRFPDMFGHLQDAFRDVVEDSAQREAPLIIVGDTLDPLHGSISAKVLDPVCDLFKEAGEKTRISMIKGNHGRGSSGTEDHLETPLGMINGVVMHDRPTLLELSPFLCGFISHCEDRDEFIEAVQALTRELKQVGRDSRPKVLFTHQAYKGGYVGAEEPGFVPDEDQGAWSLPTTLFQTWDHVFSGHYHQHQTLYLGDTPITYVGALLQHNFGDEGQTRGYLVISHNRDGLRFEHVPSDSRYPVFRKPRVTQKGLKALHAEDLSGAYVQPVVIDPAVTDMDLKDLRAYKVFPTLWEVYDKGTNRLGEDITSESSPEEILAGYVEAKCPNFPAPVRDRLLAVGVELYYKAPKREHADGARGSIKPVRLEVKNFRRAKHEVFDLDERGVTCFVGKNGAGKSTPRMGIVYALFGSMPGTAKSPVNNLVGKGCMVKLTVSCDDTLYTIMRHRQDPVYKDKTLFFRGEVLPDKNSKSNLTGATNAQTQKAIDAVLGLDLDIFSSIVCIASLFKLPSPEVKEGDKREFLEKAFGLLDWDNPYQATLAALREQRDSLTELEQDVVAKEAVKEKTKLNLADYQLKSDSWEQERRREVATIQSEIKQLEQRIAKLQERGTIDPSIVNAELQEKKDKLEELPRDGEPERKKYTAGRIKLTDQIATIKAIKATASQEIEKLEREKRFGLPMAKLSSGEDGQLCPTCQQPVTAEHIAACQKAFLAERERGLKEAREEVTEADKSLREKINLRNSLDARLGRIDANIEARRELKEEILLLTEKLSGQKEQYSQQKRLEDGLVRQKEQAAKRLKLLREKSDPYLDLIKTGKKELSDLIAEVKEIKGFLADGKARIDDLKFWEKGYSKKGVRSYLLDSYLPKLTAYIQAQLDVLSDGILRVKFSPQRVTEEGEATETFTTEVVNMNGGASYEELSSGEAHRVDIAVALGINLYSRIVRRHNVSLLFVDDVADSFIDAEGAVALARLIKGISKDIWVGLATNKPEVAAQFEKRIQVSRDKNGYSKYVR